VRVALVLGTATGGVGVHVRSLASALIEQGCRVRVCGPPPTDRLFGFSSLGAEFWPAEITRSIPRWSAVKVLRQAGGDRDIVHAHGLRAGAAATAAATAAGRRPLVVTWHNLIQGTGAERGFLALGEALVARRADVSLAASPDLAARIRSLGGRDVRDAPVAVEAPQAVRTPAAVRAELGLRPGQPLVASVGRLHRQKAHDVLVRAALEWAHRDARVVIVGDGPERAELAGQIERSAAPVALLGRRSDVADLLLAADVVVLASRWEARSLVAQEAMLLGRPLVATDVGGMRELCGDGARLVPSGDAASLARAVDELLGDPLARAALSARALRQAAAWPTTADMVAQITSVYRELTGA